MRNITLLQLPKMIFYIICMIFVSCCHMVTKKSNTTSVNQGKYFTSPSDAVKQITVLLEDKNWDELAKYYDLTDSQIERASLISGEFFYTEKRPEVAHPEGFWKYKHPFAPGFEFNSMKELAEPGVIEVTVSVEIDQGGGMIQRGLQTFLMRNSDKGYQVMPPMAQVP